MSEPLRVLSLGAGVQSSAVLLMSCHGELPKLDAAIFADTGWEPPAVYHYLLTVLEPAAEAAGIECFTVRDKGGPMTERLHEMPLFTVNPETGDPGMIRRTCTSRLKIGPLRQAIRHLLEIRGLPVERNAVHQWFGISWDEWHRTRTSDVSYIQHRYPLVEREIDRAACESWLKRHGYGSAPKSACIGCPYHSDAEWLRIKADPQMWASAVDADERLRDGTLGGDIKGTAYLHPKRIPLRDVTFNHENQQSLFGNECVGVCGV